MMKGSNDPKQLTGSAKPPLHLIPPSALVLESMAMKNGADKYGPYNWRSRRVSITTYLSAMFRHLLQIQDGEDIDPESGISHLAHIRAGAGIVIDAQSLGRLDDDRPPKGAASRLLAENTKNRAPATKGDLALTPLGEMYALRGDKNFPTNPEECDETRDDRGVHPEMPLFTMPGSMASVPESGSTKKVQTQDADTSSIQVAKGLRDVRVQSTPSGPNVRPYEPAEQGTRCYTKLGGSAMGNNQSGSTEVPRSVLQLPHGENVRSRGIEQCVQVRKRRVYCAGPMRGIPFFNFPAFDAARDLAIKSGFDPISPADLDRDSGFHENTPVTATYDPSVNRTFAERDCKALLSLRAEFGDAIALLPGWENSTGARAELMLSIWLGLAVLDATTFKPYTKTINTEALYQAIVKGIHRA